MIIDMIYILNSKHTLYIKYNFTETSPKKYITCLENHNQAIDNKSYFSG